MRLYIRMININDQFFGWETIYEEWQESNKISELEEALLKPMFHYLGESPYRILKSEMPYSVCGGLILQKSAIYILRYGNNGMTIAASINKDALIGFLAADPSLREYELHNIKECEI